MLCELCGSTFLENAGADGSARREICDATEAIRYPEGSAIRFEVTNDDDVAFVKQLAKIKAEN